MRYAIAGFDTRGLWLLHFSPFAPSSTKRFEVVLSYVLKLINYSHWMALETVQKNFGAYDTIVQVP